MKCPYCAGEVPTDRARTSCPGCHAAYEVQEAQKTGRLGLKTLAEPNPEMFNLIKMRERSWHLHQMMFEDPKQALEQLEDLWVELRAHVHGTTGYTMQDEVVDLRQQLKEASEELAVYGAALGGKG